MSEVHFNVGHNTVWTFFKMDMDDMDKFAPPRIEIIDDSDDENNKENWPPNNKHFM